MKIAWLCSLILVGVALQARAKEEEQLFFQDLDTGRKVTGRNGTIEGVQGVVNNVVADPVGQLMLAIGNLLGFINNIDLGTIDLNNINLNNQVPGLDNINIPDLTGIAAGAGGVAAAGLGSLYTLSALKAAFFSLFLKPLDVANFILAVIALALLIAWLVLKEGDIGTLFPDTGLTFRRQDNDEYSNYYNYDSYSNYGSSARAFLETPFMQRLTSAVYDAIFKYDD
ncbi:hypothetical protein SK128_028247 [Halocaridina rubra]|uniref:Uncharacterized protein n=1 Tax=Halocaridina rubra TaxID=373956 RepID=A0AAN8WSH7_HALRR